MRNGPPEAVKHDAADVLAAAGAKRLEDRVVLGIDRQHGGARSGRPPHEQRAGADETFLVGESDRSAALGRGKRRLEAGRAGDCRHDPVGRALRGLDHCVGPARRLDARAGKLGFQIAIGVGIGHGGKPRAEFARQLRASAAALRCAVTASTR